MAGSWWPAARKGDLVRYLTEEEHGRLLAAMETWSVAPGDVVLRKDDPSASLILVEEGEVEVFDESMGEPVVLASVGVGGVIGEVGFVDGEPRTHNVRARRGSRLRGLSRERLLDLVKGDPLLFAKLTIALAELVASRFRLAVRELEPVRAFAASLREPMEHEEAGPGAEATASFDEIDEPLPEAALELIKDLARRSQKDLAGV